jgi:CBS domain-containing protein
MKVRDVMSINAVRILTGASLRQASEMVAFSGASDLVVVDANNSFVGVLSEGDMMRAVLPKMTEVIEAGGTLADTYQLFEEKGKQLADQPIDPYVIRAPITLSPDDPLQKAAAVMVSKQIRRLPVIQDGKLLGTISRADVCRGVLNA